MVYSALAAYLYTYEHLDLLCAHNNLDPYFLYVSRVSDLNFKFEFKINIDDFERWLTNDFDFERYRELVETKVVKVPNIQSDTQIAFTIKDVLEFYIWDTYHFTKNSFIRIKDRTKCTSISLVLSNHFLFSVSLFYSFLKATNRISHPLLQSVL